MSIKAKLLHIEYTEDVMTFDMSLLEKYQKITGSNTDARQLAIQDIVVHHPEAKTYSLAELAMAINTGDIDVEDYYIGFVDKNGNLINDLPPLEIPKEKNE